MSGNNGNREEMAIFKFEEYEDEDMEVVVIYTIAPRRLASDAPAYEIDAESICTCHDLQSAVAIAEAWNAYYIKN